MSSTTPSRTRKSASLARLQVGKGSPRSLGRDRAIFLISLLCASVKMGGAFPCSGDRGSRSRRSSSCQHLPHSVLRGECHLGDLGDIHALGRKQNHLSSPPCHDRARASSHDPQQPVALLVADLPNPDSFSHHHLRGQRRPFLRRVARARQRGLGGEGFRIQH
jgi:hypothetical protein